MGALTALKSILSSIALFISRLACIWSPRMLLYNARFARLHELSGLLSPPPHATETSLLLGVNRFGQVLRVAPANTRRELGNLLRLLMDSGLVARFAQRFPEAETVRDFFDQT